MSPSRILIVKTSSMGDVVHALPVVADIQAHLPGVQIDWLVESAFAPIPQMHPGLRRVLPMAWRKWRGQLLSGSTWAAIGALRHQLRDERYDLVLDLQGLLKSALWARQARPRMVRGPCTALPWHFARSVCSGVFGLVAPRGAAGRKSRGEQLGQASSGVAKCVQGVDGGVSSSCRYLEEENKRRSTVDLCFG